MKQFQQHVIVKLQLLAYLHVAPDSRSTLTHLKFKAPHSIKYKHPDIKRIQTVHANC